jgi:HK97 family phage portal protein
VTLLGGLLGARMSTIQAPEVPISSATILEFLGGQKSAAGVSVSETKSMGMPAVWRAVTLNAGTAASLPLHAYRKGDGTREPLTSGQAADLLDNPHPDMTPFELWEIAYGHLQLWGNAYFRKLRNEFGQVVELWPIHPSQVRVGRDSESALKIYEITDAHGRQDPATDQTILHIPGFGYDGICGVSPIRAARQGLGLAIAAEEYGARLFGSGSLASGILQTEQRLDQGQADALKLRWKQKASGLANAHEAIVLDSGAKFQQLTIPPEDAQFIETRRFQISEIGRLFGVPAFLMGETEKSTSWGTGLEQQATGWVMFDLRRLLIRVEQRLSQMLRPGPVYARYSVEGLLRGDSAARAAWYKAMWEIGVFSTDDIRELEERAPVKGGDVRYRPLNMGVLGEADAPPAPAPPQPPPTRPAHAEQLALNLTVSPPEVTVQAPEVVRRVKNVKRDDEGLITQIIEEHV